jgi:hypothetical protein
MVHRRVIVDRPQNFPNNERTIRISNWGSKLGVRVPGKGGRYTIDTVASSKFLTGTSPRFFGFGFFDSIQCLPARPRVGMSKGVRALVGIPQLQGNLYLYVMQFLSFYPFPASSNSDVTLRYYRRTDPVTLKHIPVISFFCHGRITDLSKPPPGL